MVESAQPRVLQGIGKFPPTDGTAMRGTPALSVCMATRCDQVGDQRAQAMRPDVRGRWSDAGHGILSRSLALLHGTHVWRA
ncbi:hypothetical protein DB811_02115 [Xanthomonas perforans]|uniref:Uncharacterized protein n=1 Tax=Xanthomonas perforans TaxID=442694 RepID=A0AAQ0YNN7_XANPE|nr:hypothetical protein DB854_04375 [Xanthomonas perforans]RXD39161.1 hypothetical protein DB757_16070 [Xanthomonas perforans]RXD42954.1 hypothetical protein DB761_13250 [Xanthomonas perforans]RXD49249.1 hypothetical protein DB768_09425 [Xanthomonas perforans]RXD53859.1 hypothetical protein DB769_10480 [Xanthomonas perforans]